MKIEIKRNAFRDEDIFINGKRYYKEDDNVFRTDKVYVLRIQNLYYQSSGVWKKSLAYHAHLYFTIQTAKKDAERMGAEVIQLAIKMKKVYANQSTET